MTQRVSFGVANPATVFHRMDEIDASAKSTNAAILLNLAPGPYTLGWADWFARWERFNLSERSLANFLSPAAWLLRSDDLTREVEARAQQLNEFRAQYASQPSKAGGAPPPLEGPSVPNRPPGSGGDFPFTTVAVTVGIVALVTAALVFSPEIKGLFATSRRLRS